MIENLKLTAQIQVFSLLKVPLLGVLRPKVRALTPQVSRVRLPFSRLARNHVGSMYFGALAIGAELSIALKVVDAIQNQKLPLTFIFKDFKCQFVKRSQTDTDFVCEEVEQISALIQRALASANHERVDQTFKGFAEDREGQVMTYELTLSIKKLGGKRK